MLENIRRTDFCAPDCTCQKRFGEVLCVKLLPEVQAYLGKSLDYLSYSDLVDAVNKLWLERK